VLNEAEAAAVPREAGERYVQHDYALSCASAETPLSEFAQVLNAEHRIEQCLQRAKGEAGLSHYQVRTWRGWYHHQTLSLIATWFLTQEARRGKNMDSSAHGAAAPLVYCGGPSTEHWVATKPSTSAGPARAA
jgi:SRSO17 transposase